MIKQEAKVRIQKLRTEINHHRYLYHVLDKQEISDAALDSLKHELVKLEKEWPELITPDSPSQRVGGKALAGFKKVKHPRPILSIEDAFNFTEVAEWQQRNVKLIGQNIKGYFGELKMDGLAMVLTYEQGIFVRATTRGDGLVGEDVTLNIKTIESVPLRLEKVGMSLPERLDIRGEVVITKAELARINRLQEKKGASPFANPRNLAAGTIRQLDPKVTANRRMDFYAFEILTELDLPTHAQVHDLLKNLGFKINPHCRPLSDLAAVDLYIKTWEKKRESLPYQTDGVVIVVDNIAQESILGFIGKSERWMLAFKFPAEQATTRVKDIIVQVGRTGVLTPVAVLEPVTVAGSTVSRATLHNQDEIDRLDIRIGDTVIIQKAGDIIPDVVEVLKRMRPAKAKSFTMPNKCPACGSAVVRKAGEVAHYCSNLHCFAVARERVYHFVSRSALNVMGLGPKIIDQLMDNGLVKDTADLFTLTVDELEPLERFAETSAKKIVEALAGRRKVSLDKFIYALGIRHVGEETARDLAGHFGTLGKLIVAKHEEFEKISNIGPVVAKSLAEFFSLAPNRKLIERLQKFGVKVENYVRSGPGKFNGKTFVLTGTLTNLTRQQVGEIIRQQGGSTSESVSAQTDYVVAGENPGSKMTKAKKLGVKVLSEDDFNKLVNK